MAWFANAPQLVDGYYALRPGISPNGLVYAVAGIGAMVSGPAHAWLVTFILALVVAALGTIRLLGSATLSAGLAGLLVASARPTALGFLPNTFAVGLAFLILGSVCSGLDGRRSRWWLALTILYLLLLWAHLFVFLVVCAWTFWAMLLWPKSAAKLAVGPGVSLLAFSLLFRRLASSASAAEKLTAIMDAVQYPSWTRMTTSVWDGLFASLRYELADDYAQVAVVGLLGVGLALRCVSARRKPPDRRDGFLFLCCISGLLVSATLAENVGPPFDWWGAHLRVPVLVFGPFAALALRDSVVWFRTLFGAAALVQFLVLLTAWRSFELNVAEGVDEVVDTLPPGKKLTTLIFPSPEQLEFHGEPLGYFGNYYLLRRGGYTVQTLFGNPDVPIQKVLDLPAPGWAHAEGFDPKRHLTGVDCVLAYAPRKTAEEVLGPGFTTTGKRNKWWAACRVGSHR